MLRRSKVSLVLFHRLYCNSIVKEKPAGSLEESIEKRLNFKELKYPTKVPKEPVREEANFVEEDIEIDNKTIQLLERLSLVELDSKAALKTIKDSIQFANRIVNIDTTNVEPLCTVLEDRNLELREDEVTDGNIKDDILKNAKLTDEDYFVAPPGNIPLEQEEKKFE